MVEVDAPLMLGDTFQMTFDLPLMGEEIEVRSAMVVRRDRINGQEIEGYGVHFLAIDPLCREKVDNYVCSLLGYYE